MIYQFTKYFFAALLACFANSQSAAQGKVANWHVGYFAPFFTNVGATAGASFDISRTAADSVHRRQLSSLQVLGQVSYFAQPRVSNSLFVHPELVYTWRKADQRFFLSAAVGAAYLVTQQRQEGTLNLATGELNYRYLSFNHFVPNIQLGVGIEPKSRFGFYFKVMCGRKMSATAANAAIMGVSTGVMLRFARKKYSNDT